MNVELNKNELDLLEKVLSDAIEKYEGLSEAQEVYIRNIDAGMSQEIADQQFKIDNKKVWKYFVFEEKKPLYCLFDKLFGSPASEGW